MTTPKPQVSVVIPTRDRWHCARDAVASALAQRDVSVEVIVVDDGSEQPAPASIAADERVTVVRLPHNGGVAAARNAGAEAARAPWVAFLDDDDLWAADKLSLQLRAAEQTGASVVFAGALLVIDGVVVEEHSIPDRAGLARRMLDYNVIPAGASNVLVKAEALRLVGGFETAFRQLDDWDMWLRMVRSLDFALVPDHVVAYRQHATNHHIQRDDGLAGEIALFRERHGHYARADEPVGGADFHRWWGWGCRRAGRRLTAIRHYLEAMRLDPQLADLRRIAASLAGERLRERIRRPPAGQTLEERWRDRGSAPLEQRAQDPEPQVGSGAA